MNFIDKNQDVMVRKIFNKVAQKEEYSDLIIGTCIHPLREGESFELNSGFLSTAVGNISKQAQRIIFETANSVYEVFLIQKEKNEVLQEKGLEHLTEGTICTISFAGIPPKDKKKEYIPFFKATGGLPKSLKFQEPVELNQRTPNDLYFGRLEKVTHKGSNSTRLHTSRGEYNLQVHSNDISQDVHIALCLPIDNAQKKLQPLMEKTQTFNANDKPHTLHEIYTRLNLYKLLPFSYVLKTFRGESLYVSPLFTDPKEGSLNSIGLYKQKNGTTAVLYLLKDERGIWKILPGADRKQEWLGQGFGEESLFLPSPFQSALCYMESTTYMKTFPKTSVQTIRDKLTPFQPKFKNSPDDMGVSPRVTQNHPYFSQVEDAGESLVPKCPVKEGKNAHGQKIEYHPPSQLAIPGNIFPRFSEVMNTYAFAHPILGPSKAYVFYSEDNQLLFTFCKSTKGIRWIHQVELVASQITDSLVYSHWCLGTTGGHITMGLLTQPYVAGWEIPVHYIDQQWGNLYSAEGYLQEIPLIQEFKRLFP